MTHVNTLFPKDVCRWVHLVQPIAFGMSFHLNLQSQFRGSLFDETWQKRPTERDPLLRFENEDMTVQMQ